MRPFLRSSTLLAVAGAFVLAACEEPRAHGEAHSIVAAVPTDLWLDVEDQVRGALQPTIRTVTDERTFLLTHQDPQEPNWGDLRRFRNVLLIGTGEEPWMDDALGRYRGAPPSPPDLLQVENVWARGQTVSLVLLPDDVPPTDALDEVLEPLHGLLDARFRDYAMGRMFVSGRNVELEESLMEREGFALTVPRVYRQAEEDSVFRFRNDNPSPGELIREVVVTWRSPIPEEVTAEDLLEWREALVEDYYTSPQVILDEPADFRGVEIGDLEGVEYQGAWESPPGAWPAGGVFTTRALECPGQDRLYVMDTWLYAPGRDKYEYMIQLETIANSFRCGD